MIPVAAGHFPAAPGGRPASWAATGRSGGASRGPFAELNLAAHVGDDPDAVAGNRAALAGLVGLAAGDLAVLEAEHGARVSVVTEAGLLPPGDGAVTAAPGIGLVALAADCVPMAFASAAGVPAVGVAHCGWQGLVAGIVPATAQALAGLGAAGVSAVLGPSVCPSCFPVPPERVDAVRDACPAEVAGAALAVPGAIDVAAGVRAWLALLGIPAETVPGCTAESDALYSFRRARVTGRQGMIVRL